MYVLNFKLNKAIITKILKIIIPLFIILTLVFSSISILKRIKEKKDDKILVIQSEDYTHFLKDCHEHLENYIGKKVNLTGYVYKLPTFNDNQFVIARTMLINSNTQSVVVGILCENNNSQNPKEYTWIEIEGIIDEGEYHGKIPIIHVQNLKEISLPDNEFVYEPND